MNSRPPLVLLHGITNSARVWDRVVPLLCDDFDLIVPTFAGHRGGAPKPPSLTVAALVDEVEALLDSRGIKKAHIAGNSLGGWVALELARRGRAISVCAFSPAGCWIPGERNETRATNAISSGRRLAKRTSLLTPVLFLFGRIRRESLRAGVEHGDQLSRREAVEFVRDMVDCPAANDLLGPAERLEPLRADCPITLAWAEKDLIFSAKRVGAAARELVPDAAYLELPAVGHIAMIDNPGLCAETIRTACGN